jgi:transposase InsO family protein
MDILSKTAAIPNNLQATTSVLKGHQHARSYNIRRRHSSLGHLSPAEFEEVRLEEEDAA